MHILCRSLLRQVNLPLAFGDSIDFASFSMNVNNFADLFRGRRNSKELKLTSLRGDSLHQDLSNLLVGIVESKSSMCHHRMSIKCLLQWYVKLDLAQMNFLFASTDHDIHTTQLCASSNPFHVLDFQQRTPATHFSFFGLRQQSDTRLERWIWPVQVDCLVLFCFKTGENFCQRICRCISALKLGIAGLTKSCYR